MPNASSNALPSIAHVLEHPAFPTAVWNLVSDRHGLLPVAAGRGGPFNLSWEIHGVGPVKMMLIMGLGSLKTAWQRQTLHFGHQHRDRYSVLVFDNRGMGASDKPLLRYSTSEMAQDCVELLTHVGWLPCAASVPHRGHRRTVHVIGISLGGMIAQELACRVPAHIASLSLCCTAAAIENTTSWVENLVLRASMLVPKSTEQSIHNMARQLLPASWLAAPDDIVLPDPATMPHVHPPAAGGPAYLVFGTNAERFVAMELHKRLHPHAFGFKGFLLQLVAAGWHRKTPAQLQDMADSVGRDRILVMHGTVDDMIDVRLGQKLVDHVGPASALIQEDMGHAPIVERYIWFNETMARHMERGESLAGRDT